MINNSRWQTEGWGGDSSCEFQVTLDGWTPLFSLRILSMTMAHLHLQGDDLQDLGAGEEAGWDPFWGELGVAWRALGDPILWEDRALSTHFLSTRLFYRATGTAVGAEK